MISNRKKIWLISSLSCVNKKYRPLTNSNKWSFRYIRKNKEAVWYFIGKRKMIVSYERIELYVPTCPLSFFSFFSLDNKKEYGKCFIFLHLVFPLIKLLFMLNMLSYIVLLRYKENKKKKEHDKQLKINFC
jgi:hypothetical protein